MPPAGEPPPRVTVIIATFNRAAMLRCAIRSVLEQRFRDFELIVVGDACTDDSAAVATETNDPRIVWMNREKNCGSQWGPNNDGLARARGEYIAFLGHDDLWLPCHLEHLVPQLDRGADLAHPLIAVLGPDGVRAVFAEPPSGETYETTFVPPSGWLVRASTLRSLGGFGDHRQAIRATDFDLLRRIALAGYNIVFTPRLSVLKFPSHWWRAYGAGAAVPQQEWIEQITRDPAAAEHKLLTGSIVAVKSATPNASPVRALSLAAGAGGRWLLSRLERSRLLAPLLRARLRRQIEVRRQLRGLEKPAGSEPS